MNKIAFYNEEGNISGTSRSVIKKSVMDTETLIAVIENADLDKGKLVCQVAEDLETATPIYAVVSVTITDTLPSAKVKTQKSDSGETVFSIAL